MNKKERILLIVLACVVLSGIIYQICKGVGIIKPPALVDTKVREIDMYGDAVLDIKDIDLEYGDSVDILFSGGYVMTNVPFYPSFYGNKGDAVISDYFDYIVVGGIGCDFNATANIKPGETVSITLNEAKRYKEEFKAYDVDQDFVKWEGQTDEAFINARELDKGNIKSGVIYRGSSPANPAFNRMELMDEFIQEKGIKCILDLSESEDDIKSVENLPEHTKEMLDNGQIIALGMGVDFENLETKETLGKALVEMTEMEGPYLINCSYGKDRTGVVAALLEALCGATYEEIVDDYMLSYKNLHDINMNPDSYQYTLFKERLDEELADAFEIDIDDVPNADFETCSREYFKSCGLTDEQLDKLKDVLEGK